MGHHRITCKLLPQVLDIDASSAIPLGKGCVLLVGLYAFYLLEFVLHSFTGHSHVSYPSTSIHGGGRGREGEGRGREGEGRGREGEGRGREGEGRGREGEGGGRLLKPMFLKVYTIQYMMYLQQCSVGRYKCWLSSGVAVISCNLDRC